jgi:diguanylate cyclase (GGDEF)-like protein
MTKLRESALPPGPAKQGLMARGWSRLSLTVKLQLLIQAVLLVVMPLAQFWLMGEFREDVLEDAQRRAEVSADGVVNGMNMLMLSGAISDSGARQLLIRKMGASEGVTELRIIRAPQVQRQFGPGLPEEQLQDALDALAIESKATQVRLSERATPPTLRTVVPIIARTNFRNTNCLQCHHVEDGSVNGAVSITIDLSGDYATIRRTEYALWIGQGTLQLLLFLLVGWFTRGLLRPLKQLQKAMARIRNEANLSHRQLQDLQVPVRRRDEIGHLGETFNFMASRLQQEMHALHEAQHMQEIYLVQSREEQARLIALLSVMKFGILFITREGAVIHANPSFFAIWGIEAPPDLIGSDAAGLLERAARNIATGAGHNPFDGPDESRRTEVTLHNGRIVRVQNFEVSQQGGHRGGWLWLFEDITEDRRTAEQLIFLAERDPLTELGNRRRFHEELTRALALAQRGRASVAVLLFDLDGFKYVNDNFGHHAGDSILVRLATEIGAMIRRGEGIFRLGGDEFVILIPDGTLEEAKSLAERVVRAIARIPFAHDGVQLHVTASLGIAIYPQDSRDAIELVAHADAAMYWVKENGRNAWRAYDSTCDISREMLSRISLEAKLDSAINDNGLRLHFQGIYTTGGELEHLEALVRMSDPDHPDQLIPPSEFIPIAERSGKIRALDRWVLCAAMDLLARSSAVPPIAVNLSGRSIDEGRLAAFICDELRHRGLEPRRLILELTETAGVADVLHLRAFTQALREFGCRVCLDDFGSGFSSFVYLQHIDADILKVDGAFIRDLPSDRQNQVLVRAVIAVARGLGKLTVAEHVESAETLQLLKAMGIDLIQGYLFDRPRADHPAIAGAVAAPVRVAGERSAVASA